MLLLVLLACGDPDCSSRTGADFDACQAERSKALLESDPAAALAAARAITDPIARDLALIRVLTTPGALPDAELRAACERELQAASHRDQCRRYLERPHLRTGQGGPAGAHAVDCGADPEGDGCLYERALAGGSVDALRETLSKIDDTGLRGQALAGALRQRQARDLAELRALAGLLPLAEGLYHDEAASWLGSEMTMRLWRACPGDCSGVFQTEILPFSGEICEQAGSLRDQCFDHVCMAVTDRSLNAPGTPAELATQVRAAYDAAVAAEPRVAAIPGCYAVWMGRKLSQRGGTPAEADARCAALGPDADLCRSGLAEELVSRRLRGHPVQSAEELEAMVTTGAAAFGAPPALEALLPCGAFSVLTGQLDPKLAGQNIDLKLLNRLAKASPGCAWKDAP